jgi:hypothetical protein
MATEAANFTDHKPKLDRAGTTAQSLNSLYHLAMFLGPIYDFLPFPPAARKWDHSISQRYDKFLYCPMRASTRQQKVPWRFPRTTNTS